MKPTACFFAKVKDPALLRRAEFYAQDIDILEQLGFDVRIATSPQQIRPADLYFIWWWTWAFLPLSLATLLRRPSIITGTFDEWAFEPRPRIHKLLMRWALRRANANVFVSQLEYDLVPRVMPVRNPSFSPHAVDTAVYRPGSTRGEDEILTIAWMHGINAERKSIPEVVKAAALVHREHPSVRFTIAGERGSYYPRLEQLVQELHAEEYIQFPGAISLERKIELMQRCAIYLQPSRFEGFGLAILEAMSCGAPVITSPAGAVPEVVGDTAVLVDGTSPEAIAAAVIELLKDNEARRTLGQRARARAEQVFPIERRKHDLQRTIQQIMNQVR